jgi:hypothetical protein
MRQVQVFVSPDRHWRVEVRPDGRCLVYQYSHLVRRCATITLAAQFLAAEGVEELVQD